MRLYANFTLAQLQQYIQKVRVARARGKPLSPLPDTLLHLVEEVGELVRAARRDDAAGLSEELADCLYYLLATANEAGVDLASALISKEERNRARFGV